MFFCFLGVNKKISYSLENNERFSIDPQTGILSALTQLDREERAMYNLTVTAFDHGSPRQMTKTSILVLVSGEFDA